jgi:hypothetical protein
VEAKAGRAFRITAPFPIYPVNGYFWGVIRGRKIPASVVDEPRRSRCAPRWQRTGSGWLSSAKGLLKPHRA